MLAQALIVLLFVLLTIYVVYRPGGVLELMTNPPPTTATP